MIDKSKFRNLKGRRIYLFWLDENTGEITDVTSRSDVVQVIHCKECKYAEVADKNDSQDGYTCVYHRGSIWFSGSFCSWAERKEE